MPMPMPIAAATLRRTRRRRRALRTARFTTRRALLRRRATLRTARLTLRRVLRATRLTLRRVLRTALLAAFFLLLLAAMRGSFLLAFPRGFLTSDPTGAAEPSAGSRTGERGRHPRDGQGGARPCGDELRSGMESLHRACHALQRLGTSFDAPHQAALPHAITPRQKNQRDGSPAPVAPTTQDRCRLSGHPASFFPDNAKPRIDLDHVSAFLTCRRP
jgi:hypothetical protein